MALVWAGTTGVITRYWFLSSLGGTCSVVSRSSFLTDFLLIGTSKSCVSIIIGFGEIGCVSDHTISLDS